MERKEKAKDDENYGVALGRQSKVKLLLMDENKEELLHYSSFLERQGYDVRPLSSYRDAATRIEHESFDLLVMRQGASNFEGRSVLARMIETSESLPILVLTHRIEPGGFSGGAGIQRPKNLENLLVPSEVVQQVTAYLWLSSHAA